MGEQRYEVLVHDSPWAGPTIEVLDGPDVKANRGRPVGSVDRPYELELVVEPGADPDEFPPMDFQDAPTFRLFSSRLQDVLAQAGVDNVEYIDAEVTYGPTGESLDYAVANVVGVVSALDFDRSEVVRDPLGNVINVETLCLDEEKLAGHRLITLAETPLTLVVHTELTDAIQAAELTGCRFVPPGEYRPYMI